MNVYVDLNSRCDIRVLEFTFVVLVLVEVSSLGISHILLLLLHTEDDFPKYY